MSTAMARMGDEFGGRAKKGVDAPRGAVLYYLHKGAMKKLNSAEKYYAYYYYFAFTGHAGRAETCTPD